MCFIAPTLLNTRGSYTSSTKRYTKHRSHSLSQPHRSVYNSPKHQQANMTNQPKLPGKQDAYCQKCAAPMEQRTPPGDERPRNVCTNCNNIAYENPKVVVGCVPISKDKKRVLLARRAIPPVGKWTFPAGFLETGETAEVGAAREAWEETRARLDMNPTTLLAVYNILPAHQVQLLYQSTLLNEDSVAPGVESLEVRMFEWEDVPWEELAFPTVHWALEYSMDNLNKTLVQPHLKSR